MTDADQTTFSADELNRYARHLTLPEVGVEGQRRLKRARVLLIGAGGLGSPAALYLAAAGVGTLGVVDADLVDVSNLQRQILHDSASIGVAKTTSASARLRALNPHVAVEGFPVRLSSENAREIIRQFDMVVDGSDNFPTRYLVNDACVFEQKPLVYGSIFRFDGQVSLFFPPDAPCYRCVFAEPPPPELVPSCAEAGVLGVLPGIVGSLQALEAIKLIVGIGRPLFGRLILFDALTFRMREIQIHRDPECPVCGEHPTVTDLIDYEAFCSAEPGVHEGGDGEISSGALAKRLMENAPPVLLDVREEWEVAMVAIPGAILIPMGELPERLREIPQHREVVTVCHHGMRAKGAADFLRRAGFSNVRVLTGGIDDYAKQVGGMRRY